MNRRIPLACVGAVLVAGMLSAPARPGAAASRTSGANAVVAIVDTGINPYHKVFRDTSARAYEHPSTYIPGYPKDATALRVTLDNDKYWDAVRKDCDRIWSEVKPGTLYWFPGTKIIGAITFEREPFQQIDCNAKKPEGGGAIVDANGHGTMTASRATSTQYGACTECLVAAVQFPTSLNLLGPEASTGYAIEAIEWAAKNATWIDAQSNSWGPLIPLWEPTGRAGLITSNPRLVKAVEEVSRAHLAFWASGNGALFRFGIAGHPTLLAPHFTPSAIMVGGHDSGQINTWPGFPPHVVADSCASWAAHPDSTHKSEEGVGGGTSAATPFAAGGAARILLMARSILGDTNTGVRGDVVAAGPRGRVSGGPIEDGELTLDEWKRLVFVTASPRPEGQFEDGPPCPPGPYGPAPVRWADVPEQYPEYLQIGYGAVDHQAMKRAAKILAGEMDMPDRSRTDAYFENDRTVRETTYGAFSQP